MRIGILATADREGGGVFQYTENLIRALSGIAGNEVFVFKTPAFNADFSSCNCVVVNIEEQSNNHLQKLRKLVFTFIPFLRRYITICPGYDKISDYQMDIYITPAVSLLFFFMQKSYFLTIHDFQHKYLPHFFSFRERVIRNIVFFVAARNASMVVVESSNVANDVVKYLHVRKERISVIQLPPAVAVEKLVAANDVQCLAQKYSLPDKFLFYPAQFWHHKNHQRLLRAIAEIKNIYNVRVNLILIGSKKNAFSDFEQEVAKLDLSSQVTWLGYVDDAEKTILYKLATALVVPSLFESVSMPIWEAMLNGCPVICSNVCALPEQVADAGVLFDPYNVGDMAKAIINVYTNDDKRGSMATKGYERMNVFTLDDSANRWSKLFMSVLRPDDIS